jgi:hypothetical protein
MEPIAERTLSFQDDTGCQQELRVVIAKPEEDRGAWKCSYQIAGAYHHAGTAYGGDSVQALMLSLQAVAAHMNTPKLRGRVTMATLDGHGFPEPPRQDIAPKNT